MDLFKKMLEEKGLTLSPQQYQQFSTYYKMLVSWNEKMNLTAITDEKLVYLKHFYDSITPAFYFSFINKSVCDVGAGAGFPAIPLKIFEPSIELTIVDSLNKRIDFLSALTEELGLENVHIYHDRAETFGHNPDARGSFDVVTARAVARMPVLAEYCLPLVKTGGQLIALKGASAREELADAEKAIDLLGGRLEKVEALKLPEENSERHIAFIDKIKETPDKYPRKPGKPAKQPL